MLSVLEEVVRLLSGQGLARDMGAEGVRGERIERRESLRDSVNSLNTNTLSFLHSLFVLFRKRPSWRDGMCKYCTKPTQTIPPEIKFERFRWFTKNLLLPPVTKKAFRTLPWQTTPLEHSLVTNTLTFLPTPPSLTHPHKPPLPSQRLPRKPLPRKPLPRKPLL